MRVKPWAEIVSPTASLDQHACGAVMWLRSAFHKSPPARAEGSHWRCFPVMLNHDAQVSFEKNPEFAPEWRGGLH